MKPREGFIFLAIVTNIIGVAIAQESLFECPRGKITLLILFLIIFSLKDHCYLKVSSNLYFVIRTFAYLVFDQYWKYRVLLLKSKLNIHVKSIEKIWVKL